MTKDFVESAATGSNGDLIFKIIIICIVILIIYFLYNVFLKLKNIAEKLETITEKDSNKLEEIRHDKKSNVDLSDIDNVYPVVDTDITINEDETIVEIEGTTSREILDKVNALDSIEE
tara:strand:+ start:537 stop:890 length:354 start_codon:yes stop_codon:yes gene_type:complete